MASSSSQQGAREAPPPDQLAALYTLTEKVVSAGALCRHSRTVELSAHAALKAEALLGDDSLVVAHMRMVESHTLNSLARVACVAERDALVRRSCSALLSVVVLLRRRLATDTLLPCTVRKEEADYFAHNLAATLAAKNKRAPPTAVLQMSGSAIGYSVLIDALCRSVDYLNTSFRPFWSAGQRQIVETFVFQALDVIPRTAGWKTSVADEKHVVMLINTHLSPQNYEPAFCAAVLRKWRSDAVSSVLRARGVLQTGVAICEQISAEFRARQREDIAKHGLRDCALPSCSKTEKTVKEFAGCSGCRSVVNCCAEHQGLHWTKHKKACREKEAARLAAEEGGDNAAGAGAA